MQAPLELILVVESNTIISEPLIRRALQPLAHQPSIPLIGAITQIEPGDAKA